MRTISLTNKFKPILAKFRLSHICVLTLIVIIIILLLCNNSGLFVSCNEESLETAVRHMNEAYQNRDRPSYVKACFKFYTILEYCDYLKGPYRGDAKLQAKMYCDVTVKKEVEENNLYSYSSQDNSADADGINPILQSGEFAIEVFGPKKTPTLYED